MQIEKRRKIIIFTVAAVILIGAFSALFFIEWHVPRKKIAIIEVEGEINYGRGANPEIIGRLLRRADEDDEIKAIVLKINSEGGDAGASWEMYRAVKDVKKPVVAFIGDIGASGAYLVAVSADEIVATPMSVIGSIGAAIEFPFSVPANASEEPEEISSITSGEFKNMFRDYRLNESERNYLKERLKNVLEVFLDCVTEKRDISKENITRIAKGGWFTGEEGLHMGLVDKIGNLNDAITEAAELANISLENTKIVVLRVEDSRIIEASYG